MIINYNNVEEIFFYDSKLMESLPKLRGYWDQWKLSKVSPTLKPLGQRAKVDFINNLTSEEISKIELHFGQKISISKGLDYRLVSSHSCKINELENLLSTLDPDGYVRMHREGDTINFLVWR